MREVKYSYTSFDPDVGCPAAQSPSVEGSFNSCRSYTTINSRQTGSISIYLQGLAVFQKLTMAWSIRIILPSDRLHKGAVR